MAKDTATAPAPAPPTKCAMWRSSATRARGRPPWPRPCSSRPAPCRGPAASRGHHLSGHRGGGGPPATVGLPRGGHRRAPGPPDHTPGHPRLAGLRGELRAGLRAADAALFVVSAVNGWTPPPSSSGQVRRRRHAAGGRHHPAGPGARRRRGRRPLPAPARRRRLPAAPARPRPGRRGHRLVSLLEPHVDAPDADRLRGELIEGIIGESEDETLMERTSPATSWPSRTWSPTSRPPSPAAASSGSLRRPADRRRRPRAAGSARRRVPVPEGARLPARHAPTGSGHRADRVRPRRALVAEVVKTTTDPYLGRVSLVRVFSGTLRPDIPIHVSGHGIDRPRPSRPRRRRADRRRPPRWEPRCARSPRARPATSAPSPGSAAPRPATRCPPRTTRASSRRGTCPPRSCRWRWRPPPARTRTVCGRPGPARGRGPHRALERRPDTGQLLLWCVGEAHEVLLERLRSGTGSA